MDILQYTIISTLGIAAGISILLFDGRGKRHRWVAALVAWLMFVLIAALVGAAMMRRESLVIWLLIFIFAANVGAILIARGNINKLATHLKSPPDDAEEVKSGKAAMPQK
ncbi:hypothetical protein [Neisseria sp. S1]|uniref:hypothetical protein n=1 Tax=Neisseria sp. S1 TaxID=3318354 RepID=UPI003A89853F